MFALTYAQRGVSRRRWRSVSPSRIVWSKQIDRQNAPVACAEQPHQLSFFSTSPAAPPLNSILIPATKSRLPDPRRAASSRLTTRHTTLTRAPIPHHSNEGRDLPPISHIHIHRLHSNRRHGQPPAPVRWCTTSSQHGGSHEIPFLHSRAAPGMRYLTYPGGHDTGSRI